MAVWGSVQASRVCWVDCAPVAHAYGVDAFSGVGSSAVSPALSLVMALEDRCGMFHVGENQPMCG